MQPKVAMVLLALMGVAAMVSAVSTKRMVAARVLSRDEFDAENDASLGAEAVAEAGAELELEVEDELQGTVDAAGNIELEHEVVHVAAVENALEAFRAEMDAEAEAHAAVEGEYKPFWGRMPECCLGTVRMNVAKNEPQNKCTVYTYWACFPLGRICEDPKPVVEPKPMTYTVTTAAGDPSLGDFICNSNCKTCEKPRTNDISTRILGSLKE